MQEKPTRQATREQAKYRAQGTEHGQAQDNSRTDCTLTSSASRFGSEPTYHNETVTSCLNDVERPSASDLPARGGSRNVGQRGASSGQKTSHPLQASSASDSDLNEGTGSTEFPFGSGSLVTNVHNVVKETRDRLEFSPAQRRTFHRMHSTLSYWIGQGRQLVRVEVTTKKGDRENGKKLSVHFTRWLRGIERRYGWEKIDFIKVRTGEGGGVIHAVLALPVGETRLVDYHEMSAWWGRVHGAPVVWLKKMGNEGGDVDRVSFYFVNQYLAGGQSAHEHCSFSHGSFGFSLVKLWLAYKKVWVPYVREVQGDERKTRYRDMLKRWCSLMRGEAVGMPNGEHWTLQSIRAGWGEFDQRKKKRRRPRMLDKGYVKPYDREVRSALDWVSHGNTWRDAPERGLQHVERAV